MAGRKIRQEYTDYYAAFKYMKWLKGQGYKAAIYSCYRPWTQESIFIVDLARW